MTVKDSEDWIEIEKGIRDSIRKELICADDKQRKVKTVEHDNSNS